MSQNQSAGGPVAQKHLLLLKPRGFCAGVVRAIDVVNIALDLYGPPVYVRKEIVHNKHVVEELRRAGAIFVEELDEVPEGARAIFSAHGVSPAVPRFLTLWGNPAKMGAIQCAVSIA
jgi:4-hydroxy-3-methylbut-2-enyl diphosphate reductase